MRSCYRLCVVAALAGLVAVPSAAFAGHNFGAKIAVHVKAHGTSCTEGFPSFNDCNDMITTWHDCGDVDVIPVIYDLIDYTSIRLVLYWPGEWGSMQWTRCKGNSATGDLVHPTDYTVITWDACQYTWAVGAGYGWLHTTSQGFVCGFDSQFNKCQVLDCDPTYPRWDFVCPTCSAICGSYVGDDPCVSWSKTSETTWGAVKAAFGD